MTSRSLEKAEAAVSEIEAAGVKGTLSALQLDVTDEKSTQEAADYVAQQFGGLDVLINNAGVGSRDPNVKARFQLCLETNVIGPALVADAFRPLLLKSQNAYSIFVGSGERTLVRNATQPVPANIGRGDAYQVSKAALNMLAVLEFRDFGPRGIKVFVVSPGFVRSNLRGPTEEERSGWGKAGDPEVSGRLMLSIIQGERDEDVGGLVYKDGVHAW